VADGILAFGADLVIVSANPAAERVFRAEPGTLVGRGVDELIEGMELDEIRGHLGAAAAGSSETVIGRRVEVTARRDDGERFPLELTVSETRVGGERMFVGAGSDLSASHAAALALRQSERRFRAIFESAAIGIGLMHVQGALVDANAALAEMLRRPLEEIRGASLPALLALDTDPEIRALLRDLAAGRRVQGRRELQYVAADGTTLWASFAVSVLQEDSGRPARFAIVLLEDITARHESERLKDEFVSAVSHELRTPLTSIRGSLGLLTGGMMGALPPDAASLLGVAAENAERLVRLVNDILDIERLGSGRMALEIETISGARLLEDAGDVVRATADEAGVTLELAEDDGVVVHADPDRVVQTLANLLSNAIKFSPRGSRVHAEVRRDAGLALFTVRDEGRGIPADQFEVVFERFRQLDGSDSREKGGTGLGLAIARTIVEQHGGRIWVESTEGEGATFHFTLPADGAAA
jgi:PAS domain S-box-containing protein